MVSLTGLIALPLLASTKLDSTPYWRGVDMSFIPEYRDLKATYYVQNKPIDPLVAMKNAGANMLRLRVWVNPEKGFCDTSHTVQMASEAKNLGMEVMIDFHYSDFWADPAKQYPPKQWAKYNLEQMCEATRLHTKEVLIKLKAKGVDPKIIAIGNEVRPGMMWPIGQISKNGYAGFTSLLKAGVKGAEEAQKQVKLKPFQIMIHNDAGGDKTECDQFYSKIAAAKVRFDVIGLSYYPWWHGTLDQLKSNLDNLATKFNRPVIVTETAYPFTNDWKDKTGNFVYEKTNMNCSFPNTIEGQSQFLTALHQVVKSTPNRLGQGVLYWAPEYIAHPGIETPCENLALFDFNNQVLPGAYALGEKTIPKQ
jgi:arabinogalactan endo-1,4-beta-galactosidase